MNYIILYLFDMMNHWIQ